MGQNIEKVRLAPGRDKYHRRESVDLYFVSIQQQNGQSQA